VKFRLKALALHLLSSALALGLIVGFLYLVWYRWPGWYLAGSIRVTLVMIGVDVVVGPLLTGVVASPSKSRRELGRDIGVIVAMQLVALGYGSYSLWSGRPLYYTYSEGYLQLVQSYDISPEQRDLAADQNPTFAPHWYSTPRWVWVPLPSDERERDRISAGGQDVIDMPRYFRPWAEGLPALKQKLKKVNEVPYFNGKQKDKLKQALKAAGYSPESPNCLSLTGRGKWLLAVFDDSPHMVALFKAE
jgi:hypothetical protein